MLVGKDICCGCEACKIICPRHAIFNYMDEEGFWYPYIDKEKCINCKLCESVCPVLNATKLQIGMHDICCYASYLTEENLLMKSSSGGVAFALAKSIIDLGGVVFGVSYIKDFKSAEYIVCDKEEDIERIRGTKYIQARKGNLYKKIQEQCEEGRRTLVVGLPCEIAAVKSFLGKAYDNLYTCDLICHGPTSEKVQREYVDDLERRYKSKMVDLNVRYKKRGWVPLYLQAKFANANIYEKRFDRTDLFHGFALLIRPSCYSCMFKGNNRVADITIGDFWGEIQDKVYWNANGVSAVMVHTNKGKSFFENASGMYKFIVKDYDIRKGNSRIDTCELEMKNRKKFVNIMNKKNLKVACIRTRKIRKTICNAIFSE